ncbi:MAG: hypothetical protein ACRDUA_12950 [Micromonosporaceae bacterium]
MDLNTVVWGMQLVWWLVIGLVLVGLLVLVMACVPVLRRLAAFRHSGLRLQRLAEAGQALGERTGELQQRSERLAAQAGQAQLHMARLTRDR